MEPLEVVLRRTEDLRRDLSAEKVIQEEIWEEGEEILGDSSWNYGMPTGKYEKSVRTQPEIKEQDTQKRESAKQELQRVYDSSEWYSARYFARRALGDLKLENLPNLWLSELEKRVNATKTLMKEVDDGHYAEVYQEGRGYYGGSSPKWVPNIIEKPFDEPDKEVRIKAIDDYKELLRLSNSSPIKELIKKAYRKNELASVRRAAGKSLGYSMLRIWIHELFHK